MSTGKKKGLQQLALALYRVDLKDPDYSPDKWPPHCREVFQKIKYASVEEVMRVKAGLPGAMDQLLNFRQSAERARLIHRRANGMSERGHSEDDWRCMLEMEVLNGMIARGIGQTRYEEDLYEAQHLSNRQRTIGAYQPGLRLDSVESSIHEFGSSSASRDTPSSQFEDERELFWFHRNASIIKDDLDCNHPQPLRRTDLVIGLNVFDASARECYAGGQSHISSEVVLHLGKHLSLTLSPFSDEKKRGLVLPFIVGEAKKASESWEAVEKQAALCAAKFLRIQLRFQAACGVSASEEQSLVWILGTVGPRWRIYGCYSTRIKDKKAVKWKYNILQLCDVDLRFKEDVIRLLDIIDIITEWAVAYRRSCCLQIKELYGRLVRQSSASTLVTHVDVGAAITSSAQVSFPMIANRGSEVIPLRPSTSSHPPQNEESAGTHPWPCTFCRAENDLEAETCVYCGRGYRPPDPWVCTFCKAKVDGTDEICGFCGRGNRL